MNLILFENKMRLISSQVIKFEGISLVAYRQICSEVCPQVEFVRIWRDTFPLFGAIDNQQAKTRFQMNWSTTHSRGLIYGMDGQVNQIDKGSEEAYG